MTTTHKTLSILGIAVLAAEMFGAVKPAAASGLTHTLQIGQKTVVADHDANWNDQNSFRRDERRQEEFRQAEFRRQQEIRRQEERRREEWQRNHWQEGRDSDRHDVHRDRHQDNHDWQGDNR